MEPEHTTAMGIWLKGSMVYTAHASVVSELLEKASAPPPLVLPCTANALSARWELA
jgi:hypothetical protein